MRIGILGTGSVGTTIASKLIELGHQVLIGTRATKDEKISKFAQKHENKVIIGSYAEAASFGEIIFNCIKGEFSIDALKSAGKGLEHKIVVDLSIPVDTSKGAPLSLIPHLCNTNSLGEEIQKTFPNTQIVKTLNTMWSTLMVKPEMLNNGDHTNFICGNDNDAKSKITALLTEIGWKKESILDLGDITASRGTEATLLLWLRIWGATLGTFSIKVVN